MNQPINHKHVFDAANDLRIGSEILEGKFGQPVFPLRSTVVTTSFAAELYFKCLLYIHGKSVPRGRDGHNLYILYKALGVDLQQKIEANLNETTQRDQSVLELTKEFKNTFIDWRYVYDRQSNSFSLNFRSLRMLVQILDKTVREIKPEWT